MAKVEDAIEFLRQSNDADSENRQLGLQALRFRYGDQWPQYAIASRGLERPQLTINETNVYLKKVTNAQRQQRPRGKASPVDSFADKKVAKVITGLGRHIEVNSDADNAYDTAFDFAATIGWGYWRLRADYVSEDSFDQDIFVDVIDNPFTVYFDPNSRLPDGSDAEGCIVTDLMRKKVFEKEYPGAQMSGFSARGTGDSEADWISEQDIRLAEYFYIDRVRSKLVMLSDKTAVWDDQIPPVELMAQFGITIVGDRESFKRVVKWCKQTAFEILEEKTLPGRWIPIIPVYWTNVIIDHRRVKQGLVKDAMDPQRMVNFWQTSITESIALAPKAKWLIPEGGDEGHEREFAQANLSPNPVLRFKTKGVDGADIPAPIRLQPEPPPAGAVEATFLASQNLSRVLGVFDPAVRGGAQHKSDKTLNAERGQSEMTNFDGYDNLVRSIKHSWRIMLSYFPAIYDTERVMRIIGEDGKDSLITINEKTTAPHPETGEAIAKVLNDVTVGQYDVVMETGPGYDTRRQEGVVATMELMNTPVGEKIAQTADDLIVRQMDFPGADMIADRLAAANPLSQIDEKDEVPPKVQMMVKGLQANLQKAEQMIQGLQMELKYRGGVEQMKQEGATKRALLETTTRAHDSELRSSTYQHDVETRAVTAQNVEEIKGIVALLLKHIDTRQLEREIEARNQEQQIKAAEVPMPLQ